ncbi:hypothetical protein Gotur_030769, partial [Gossypium turneri]
AAITFDLKFSYVLAGWEGSAHDSRILSDALSRPGGLRISEGKYYLADAGYGIRIGCITPYRGVRYHLKEFTAKGPENAKELFNLHHSSLRITVERLYEASEFDLIIPTLTEREERQEAREWSAKRDEIAQTIWTDYMARNIRWTKSMEHVFLEILAKEARKGNKPSNTFKAVSINQVVDAIFERFQVQCDVKHVENH